MPPLDLVIVSHHHYDHLDYPTIRALAALDVPFVTSLGVAALPNSGLTVTAAPSQHFSGRGLKDRNATLWSSFVLRSERHAARRSGDAACADI
jgi:L-ascorbate metabolism protein UlaG (beta-lactamase superfamily)